MATKGQLSKAVVALRISRLEALEKRFIPDIKGVFTSQERLFLKALRNTPKVQMEGYKRTVRELDVPSWWAEAWQKVETNTELNWKKVLVEMQTPAIIAGANDALQIMRMQAELAVQDPRVLTYLQTNSATRISAINETTREAVQSIIMKGQEAGWSYEELAKALHQRFEEFRVGTPQAHLRTRAELIAVTEVGDAYCEGPLLAGRDLAAAGFKMTKSWLTVGDDRVSAGCNENESASAIALESQFPSGHMRPLRFPGCRCSLQTYAD